MIFCERQCALIHIEQAWLENRWTAEGRILHEKVHEQDVESRAGVRIERGIPLRSVRLGLVGVADVIEYHSKPGGGYVPFPVEYKRGRPKRDRCDEVQLCGQAICIEEMMGIEVPNGALFYGKTRHRFDVTFDGRLRQETEDIAERVHALIASGITPKALFEKKCSQCSLIDICLPKTVGRSRNIKRYLLGAIEK
jgi:CRISPR-associated exonuclease Cas4